MTAPRHERPAQVEVRSAKIAAIAAIMAALISCAGGVFTYVSTQNQIAAEDKRAVEAFHRVQRQDAYVQFGVDELVLDQAEEAFAREASFNAQSDAAANEDTEARMAAAKKKVEESLSKVLITSRNLQLTASPEASDFVRRFTEEHKLYASLVSKHDVYNYDTQATDQVRASGLRDSINDFELRLIREYQADVS